MTQQLKWKKQVPNEEGYWLRVNAGHRVQLHKVWHEFGSLQIMWGWGSKELCKVKDIKAKLRYFYWYGPLPEPPEEAL